MAVIRTIFRFIWAQGGEADTSAGLQELARHLGVSDLEKHIADPEDI